MKVLAVGTDPEGDAPAAMRTLSRALDGGGPVATVEVGRRDGDWTVHVERPHRTIEYRGDDGMTLLCDVLDELAEAGMGVTLLSGPTPFEVATLHLGPDSDPGAVATIDPEELDGGEPPPALEAALADVEPHVTLESLVRRATDHPEADRGGAVATFTGRVRAENLEDRRTTHLEYEKYEDVADRELTAIREELLARDGVIEVLFHHNTGVVEAGEDAVYVVVLAGHREEAFAACRDGIDRLKERVPIFKKEVTESGEYWAHDRP